jgi:HK97 gp10 family phage protein
MAEQKDLKIGIGRVNQRLLELQEVARAEVLKAALGAGLELVVNGAKELVPVLSGDLQRSIHYEVTATHDNAEGRVGSNLDYAMAAEYGLEKYGINRKPSPYMRPAIEGKEDAVRTEVVEALRAAIHKALGKP